MPSPIQTASGALGLVLLMACTGPGRPDRPPGPPGAGPRAQAAAGPATSTQDVLCQHSTNRFNASPAVNASSTAQWRCEGGQRLLSANGLPDHAVGDFPNKGNPNTIRAQAVSASFPIAPVPADQAVELGGPRGTIGFVLNGVKIDAGTNGACDDSGSACDEGRPAGRWRMEALGSSSFNFGTDSSNAHVQPGGVYHYHGIPEAFVAAQGKGRTMTLIGWAADGFPIYARYGFSVAGDSRSAIKGMASSYRLKPQPDTGRPATSLFPLGKFTQDYQFVAGLGDLDECNGRSGVTPEFPGGIYHYFATDSYPYLQRCVKGVLPAGLMRRPPPPRPF